MCIGKLLRAIVTCEAIGNIEFKNRNEQAVIEDNVWLLEASR